MTPPRIELAGGIFHTTSRAIDRRRLFLDANDEEALLCYLGRAVARYEWLLHGYCLMPNHVHLLVETPVPTLGAGMQHVNGSYAQRFNRRRDRTGHVFEGRYWSGLVDEQHYLATTCYVALNPVRACLCERPADWLRSSFAALAGLVEPPPFLAVHRVRALVPGGAGGYGTFVESVADMSRALGEGHVDRPGRGTGPVRR